MRAFLILTLLLFLVGIVHAHDDNTVHDENIPDNVAQAQDQLNNEQDALPIIFIFVLGIGAFAFLMGATIGRRK